LLTDGQSSTANENSVDGRTAIVTGGGRGIGRAIAIRLAREGYSIGLVARSAGQIEETADLVRKAGGKAEVCAGDVADPAAVELATRTFLGSFGHVDVVVNNAACTGPMSPFLDIDTAEWRRVLETNIIGPVLLLKSVLPSMLARGHGYVVNVNSLQGSDPSGSPLPYGVSKAGLMRLTDGLAGQLAGTGIVVVDLSPGLVHTELTSERADLDALPDSAWAPPEQAADQLARLVSGRYDQLHGRFVRAADDLDGLSARLAGEPNGRILRLTSKEIAVPLKGA